MAFYPHMSDTDKETINTLFNHFFPGSEEINEDTSMTLDSESPPKITVDDNNRLFTYMKITKAFKSFRSYKSPGPDCIQPILLKNLDSKTLDRIAYIYEACYLFT